MAAFAVRISQDTPLVTREEYLNLDFQSEARHEYDKGVVTAMSGASLAHNLIVGNLVGRLGSTLSGGPCAVLTQGMRVGVPRDGWYRYPDVVVICDKPQIEDDRGHTLLNPTVLIEVISPSTGDADRGKKLERYQTLPSLIYYLIVEQSEPRVEIYARKTDIEWSYISVHGLDAVVPLDSIGCSLRLRDIYERIEFEELR